MSSPQVQRDALCHMRLCPCTWCHLPLRAGEQVITQMFTNCEWLKTSLRKHSGRKSHFNTFITALSTTVNVLNHSFTQYLLMLFYAKLVWRLQRYLRKSACRLHQNTLSRSRRRDKKKCQLSQSKSTNKMSLMIVVSQKD